MKIAIITVKLVPEADDVPNKAIEKEILEHLEDYPRIPYMEKVKWVKVLSNPEKGIRTSITITEESKKRAEEIKNTLPFLKSFGAVVEYCIAHVYNEVTKRGDSARLPKKINSFNLGMSLDER